MYDALLVRNSVSVFVVPRFSTAIMRIKNTFTVVPDDGSSNTWREARCYDTAIGLVDAREILKPFEFGQVDLIPVLDDVLALMAIRVLALLLGLESKSSSVFRKWNVDRTQNYLYPSSFRYRCAVRTLISLSSPCFSLTSSRARKSASLSAVMNFPSSWR